MLAVAVMAASGGYFVAMMVAPGTQQTATQLSAINQQAMASNQIEDIVGQPRPEFSLADTRGSAVSVNDYDGQLLLINFWATWCTPCVEEMPMLSELQNRYEDRGFQIVGIALDDPAKASEFASELGVGYPILVGVSPNMSYLGRLGSELC